MANTNVKSEWVSGNLVFYDKSANEILTIDGTNRKLSIPSGSALDNAGTIAFTGTQTFDEIVGNDSSLGITGQAATAATGGAVAIAGGATTTSGVGGAVTVAGGAGSGTSAGGAASVTGGASGSGATGNGGAASIVGGAAASTNGSGGAVAGTGGVATGTGTGGAVTLTGGASAGASGTGGSINLASGAATGGTEGAVNVQTVATGKLGFFGATAVTQASAYTQTYATADKTHANLTATAHTYPGSGNMFDATPADLLINVRTDTVGNAVADIVVNEKSIADNLNQAIADITDVKQLVNSIIDDLQAYGLVQ